MNVSIDCWSLLYEKIPYAEFTVTIPTLTLKTTKFNFYVKFSLDQILAVSFLMRLTFMHKKVWKFDVIVYMN